MPPGTALPEHANLYVTLDVIEPEVNQDGDAATQPFMWPAVVSADTDFLGYRFAINWAVPLPEKCA